MFLTSSFSNSCSGVTTGATSGPSEPSSSLDAFVVSTTIEGASSPSISPSSAAAASFFLASFFLDFVFGDAPSSSGLVVVSLVGGRFARLTFLVVVVVVVFFFFFSVVASFSFSLFLLSRVTSRLWLSPFDPVSPVSVAPSSPSSSSLSRFFLRTFVVDPIGRDARARRFEVRTYDPEAQLDNT